jgi:outer membrane protein assembly complex protein YaeT
MGIGWRASVVLLAAAFAPAGAASTPEAYQGKRIEAVRFDPPEQPLTRDQLDLALAVRAGGLYSEREISLSIERLFATGRFRDISVDAQLSGAGVALTFRTTPQYFIGHVGVEGVPPPPSLPQLVSATDLTLGTPFEDDSVGMAADHLVDMLRANGYYAPLVSWEQRDHPRTQEYEIHFRIDAGQRAYLSRPAFSGELAAGERRLIRATGWLRWFGLRGYKPLTETRLEDGLDRLRKFYEKRGHLTPQVTLTSLAHDDPANTVKPYISVQPGSRVRLRTEGAKVSQGSLRRLVPVYQERAVERELLLEGRRKLATWFQARGYFDAAVDFSVSDPTPAGEQTIIYRVRRGPRSKLAAVAISGNKFFDTATLREQMSITPASFLRYRRGRFSEELLAQDEQSILELYRGSGFRGARVKTSVVRDYGGKRDQIAAQFEIDEGTQWKVAELDVAGVDLQLYETVLGLLASHPGRPYSETAVAGDRDAILNYYLNNGYPEVSCEMRVTELAGGNQVKVIVRVTEGRRNYVREVIVRGLKATRPELVENRLVISPMQPLSQARIVETQRRLYDLGIFARVDVAVQNPEGRERNKYVVLDLEEGSRYSFTLGYGAEIGRIGGGDTNFSAPAGTAGFSPRVLLGVARSNFLGLAHTADITTRISAIQRRLILNYLAPQFLGKERFNLTLSTLADQSKDIRTYTSRRLEGAIQLGQRVSTDKTLQYRFTLRRLSTSDLKIDPGLVPIYSQPVRTGLFSASFILDRRDDPLDSTRGFYNTVDFGVAARELASETEFTRLVLRNSTYHKVAREVVLARSVSFGWLHNLLDTPTPLSENFFGGGATTHRGFPENQAGPRDRVTGFPVGGNAFLFHGVELRFPLIGHSLGGVVFHDMGNVYSEFSAISLRYRQRDRTDFDYMVQAAGVGFRVKSPVGPFRVDLAWAPNSARFVGFQGTQEELTQGLGRRGVPLRVRPFQFHFSLGQAF